MSGIKAVLFYFGGVPAEEGFGNGLKSLAKEQRLPVDEMTAGGMQDVQYVDCERFLKAMQEIFQ